MSLLPKLSFPAEIEGMNNAKLYRLIGEFEGSDWDRWMACPDPFVSMVSQLEDDADTILEEWKRKIGPDVTEEKAWKAFQNVVVDDKDKAIQFLFEVNKFKCHQKLKNSNPDKYKGFDMMEILQTAMKNQSTQECLNQMIDHFYGKKFKVKLRRHTIYFPGSKS